MNQAKVSLLRADIEVLRGGFHLQALLSVGNEVLVLFGPSGSGKSTILHTIAGLITPNQGEITLDGTTLFRRDAKSSAINLPSRARRVGYVLQDYALFPHLTALGNVSYPLWRRPEAESKARDLLERVGLEPLADRYPVEMSGGQRQRVAIARALAAEPKVLLLDEPFSALDVESRRQARGEIRKLLLEARLPVVLVTHDKEEALAMGDSVVVLEDGRVVASGAPLDVLGHPTEGRVARLTGVENLMEMSVGETHPREGTMICVKGDFRLEVPLSDARAGERVTVGIRASEIMVASEEPRGLSARNRLPGRVVSVEAHGAGYEVVLDCGAPLRCHVTQGAIRELGIKPGAGLWAVIKASSIFLVG